MQSIRLNTYWDSIELARVQGDLNRLSSPLIKRQGTVQKHTAVNPRAIQAPWPTVARYWLSNSGLQFFADVPLGRIFFAILKYV